MPRSQASAFGVDRRGADNKIKEFLEKPADPPGLSDDPEASFASMGNYIFTTGPLIDALTAMPPTRTLATIWAAISFRVS